MTAKCIGCGLTWNVSINAKIPKTGYICPHCESRRRAGEALRNERQQSRQERSEQRAKN